VRKFSVQGREYMALIIDSDHDDFESMEVVELHNGKRGELLLEFRLDQEQASLVYIGSTIDIPLLRASVEVFREEFLEPRKIAGLPLPPW
jgi:hypothetical protein